MSDLVGRLRTSWDVDRSIISQTSAWDKERKEAADEITALRARLAELEVDLARRKALDEAMRSWLAGEPSKPPTTGLTPRALVAQEQDDVTDVSIVSGDKTST